MVSNAIHLRQEAHELIDRMALSEVSVAVGLLQSMVNPVSRSIANIPYEDEEIGEEEERAVAASKAWLAAHPGEGIAHEEILAEFGFTAEDLV